METLAIIASCFDGFVVGMLKGLAMFALIKYIFNLK